MKVRTKYYVQRERAVVEADGSGIRQRWVWGLSLLHDEAAMSPNGGGLRHGVAAELIKAAKKAGLTLSEREIRYRLQAARAYPTASQIGSAAADFKTWRDMCDAGFPPFQAPAGELPFDWRTEEQKRHERAKKLPPSQAEQMALFADCDPETCTLADLEEYAARQRLITQNFQRTCDRRDAYLAQLVAAAGGNMSMLWEQAAALAGAPVP